MRLGEMLLAHKMIDERQLKAALDAQLIYGGHLGTCLIELGYVDDESLGRMLAAAHGVAYVPRDRVLEPERDVLGIVPATAIEKHCAVPFHLEDRTVHLAMIEPTNLDRIDELAFISGHPVQAFVSPEIVIRYAMERHFQIPRESRYIAVSETLASRIDARRPADAAVPVVPVTPEAESTPAPTSPIAPCEPEAARPTAAANTVQRPQSGIGKRIEGGEMVSFGRRNLNVNWVKQVTDAQGGRKKRWCSLLDLPLGHQHFDDLEGVYVVWHHGVDPVIRVGHGRIREELTRIAENRTVRSEYADQEIFVTWATIPPEHRGGVEGYLTNVLHPTLQGEGSSAPPIQVNLPQ